MLNDVSSGIGWRSSLLIGYIAITVCVLIMLPPIAQDPAYHAFADQRPMFGMPNALNVLSNVPFFVVGLLGIRAVSVASVRINRNAWLLLFGGIALVSFGSAYYHWYPDDSSLVWDRLPMTLGFMGLLVALTREYFDNRIVRHALLPAAIGGIASVGYWVQTGDLRFYLWIQFMPLGLILLLVALYRSRYTHGYLLGIALLFYALAKLAEYYDAYLFHSLSSFVSGHTVKHLLAAAGGLLLVALLRLRELREAAQA